MYSCVSYIRSHIQSKVHEKHSRSLARHMKSDRGHDEINGRVAAH